MGKQIVDRYSRKIRLTKMMGNRLIWEGTYNEFFKILYYIIYTIL